MSTFQKLTLGILGSVALCIMTTLTSFVVWYMVTRPTPSPPPTQIAKRPELPCVVPDIAGLDEAAAEKSITDLGLRPVKSNDYNDIASGIVISQVPPPGTKLERCEGEIIVVVSLGPIPTPGPTSTPLPTSTPEPTATLEPPTATPTPAPLLCNGSFDEHWSDCWTRFGRDAAVENVGNDKTSHGSGVLVTETTKDQLVSGITQSANVSGLKGLFLEATMTLQTARFSGCYVCPNEPPSLGTLFLLFKDSNDQILGEVWWYATRGGPNPADDRSGHIFVNRIEPKTWTNLNEDLYTLALDHLAGMNPDAVTKIEVYLGAASEDRNYWYPGNAWLTEIDLYYK